MLVLLALIYLSRPVGLYEYTCYGSVEYWYAQDASGLNMQGRTRDFVNEGLKAEFLDKVINQYLLPYTAELCEGKSPHDDR